MMGEIDLAWLKSLPPEAIDVLLIEAERALSEQKLWAYYPDAGPLRRELYRKHMQFFRLGKTHGTRGFIAGNRIGKTEGVGGYELTLHLTGRYPEWWEGRRFDDRVRAWVAGDTGKTVREITQEKLLGSWGKFGTGLIPASDIVRWTVKAGVAEAVDTLWVRHYKNGKYTGEDSRVVFKSYDQGREAFQGSEQEVIWLDEESNESIRTECILRLMTTNGLLMETFTPLRGLTPVVMQYLADGTVPEDGSASIGADKALVMAGWDDAPHLGEVEKARMLAETPPHLRDARSKGVPSLGSGAIYPVPESDVVVDDFQVPAHWHRLYALDVGWNRTACLWGAIDRDTDTIYLIAEHYRGQAEPSIHAHAIKSKGATLRGIIDPASRGRSQADGTQLLAVYRELGLVLGLANNAVESGVYEAWQRLSTGRLKIFASLQNLRSEYRTYRRDDAGRIVKERDHLMDCMRYLCNAKPSDWKPLAPKAPDIVTTWSPADPGMGY
jgi:phage terminase large subunit-like protein